jgi:hypothetical protein
MKTIFIDAKYTNPNFLTQKPISISLLDMESEDKLYLEFTDYDLIDCTSFVKKNIIPKLRLEPSNLSIKEGMSFIDHWLTRKGSCLIVGEGVGDYFTIAKHLNHNTHLQHFILMDQLVIAELGIEDEEDLKDVMENILEEKQKYFKKMNKSEYHAGEDAEAMYYAYKKVIDFKKRYPLL